MVLSGVYTVCLMFSLLWETQIVHTKLDKNIEKIKSILTFCPINAMDTIQSTLMTVGLTFFLLSAHDIM